MPVTDKKPCKVLIIGIDSATWNIIDPLIEKGVLPNFNELIKRGIRAPLNSMEPLLTPIIWTTIATGKSPAKHGITGFYNTSLDVKSKRVWEILEKERDMSVGIFQWPIISPTPQEINGFCVTHNGVAGKMANPHSYAFIGRMLRGKKMGNDAGVKRFSQLFSQIKATIFGIKHGMSFMTAMGFIRYILWSKSPFTRIFPIDKRENKYRRIFLKRKIFGEIFCHLLDEFHPDFAVYYIAEADHLGHRFWKEHELKVKQKKGDGNRKYLEAIQNIYQKIDLEIGRILQYTDENTVVMLVSDHGMRGINDKDINIRTNKLLNILGIESITEVWKQPCKIFIWPQNVSINECGGENACLSELERIFENIRISETGESAFIVTRNLASGITATRNPRHEYDEHMNLMLEIPGKDGKSINCRYDEIFCRFGPDDISGAHDLQGIFLIKGPYIKKNLEMNAINVEVSILDIVPTLLFYLGLPVSKDMDGRIVTELFEKEFINDNPIRFIDNYESGSRDETTHLSDEARKEQGTEYLKKTLRSMGYID